MLGVIVVRFFCKTGVVSRHEVVLLSAVVAPIS